MCLVSRTMPTRFWVILVSGTMLTGFLAKFYPNLASHTCL